MYLDRYPSETLWTKTLVSLAAECGALLISASCRCQMSLCTAGLTVGNLSAQPCPDGLRLLPLAQDYNLRPVPRLRLYLSFYPESTAFTFTILVLSPSAPLRFAFSNPCSPLLTFYQLTGSLSTLKPGRKRSSPPSLTSSSVR
jgi:hypothetical protein